MTKRRTLRSRGRALLFIACLMALFALCLYSGIVGPRQIDTIAEVLAHSEEAAANDISLLSNVRVKTVAQDSLQLQQAGAVIEARIPPELEPKWREQRSSIRFRDFISVRAVYDPAGYLVLKDFHIHRGRTFKIWLSGVALLFATAVMVHEWRREKGA